MGRLIEDISDTTGVPAEQVRHILDEFIKKTGTSEGADEQALIPLPLEYTLDQPVLPLFEEAIAA